MSPDVLGSPFNERLVAAELTARGAHVELLDYQTQLWRVRLGGRVEWLFDFNPLSVPHPTFAVAQDKHLCRKVLREAGVPVPEWNRFLLGQLNEALLFAPLLGWPVVVKPCALRQGLGVHTDLSSMAELEDAARDACATARSELFLLEKQHRGVELRVFITSRREYAVARREPASVVGDGEATLEQLMQRETQRRTSPRESCLGPIVPDASVRRHLQRQGLTLSSVPARGATVRVRGFVEAQGAFVEDCTDDVHPSIVAACERAFRCFPGLLAAGLDVLVEDPRTEWAAQRATVIELNASPALGLHSAPGRGVRRNVAGAWVDAVFPEAAERQRSEQLAAIGS